MNRNLNADPTPAPSPLISTLFVYGTLKQASSHPLARRLQNQSVYIGPGWMSGKLYLIGSYPGAVPSDGPHDKVFGEAVRLTNPARSFAWMDPYEGCGEGALEPHDYERIIVPVTLQSGLMLDSWVYVYRLPVSRARLIPAGRFLRY